MEPEGSLPHSQVRVHYHCIQIILVKYFAVYLPYIELCNFCVLFFTDLAHLSRLDTVMILAGFYTYLISLVSVSAGSLPCTSYTCSHFAVLLLVACLGNYINFLSAVVILNFP
jgi:hypothetical protein